MNDAVHKDQSLKKLVAMLYGSLFFNIFPEEELRSILQEARLIKWKKYGIGSKVFREGSFDQHFYVVIRGVIDIRKSKGPGNEVGVGTINKGEVFGEMVVCDPEKPRRVSAQVGGNEDAILCEIDATLVDSVSGHLRTKFLKKFLDLILGRFPADGPQTKYYEDLIRHAEENNASTRNDFFSYTLETAISPQNRLTQYIKYTDFLVARKIDVGKAEVYLRQLIGTVKDELDKSLPYST